jgi:hypothetical protein
MPRNAAVLLVLPALLVGGCADQRLAEYHPGGAVTSSPAPYKADYALSRHEEPDRVVLWRGLSEKELVGFGRNEAGELVAVAGADHIPLTDGRYFWRITPETELHGLELVRHDTARTAVDVARFSGQVVLGVLLFPVVVLWGIPVSPFPF